MTNIEFANALVKLADLYRSHPEAYMPTIAHGSAVYVFCDTKEQFTETLKAFGGGTKGTDGTYLEYTPACMKPLEVQINVSREKVCERRVIGTRRVEEYISPAREERVVPAHEEEIVEWDCTPFLSNRTENE